jgi:hypothetical protein
VTKESKPAFTATYAHEARLDLDIGYQRVTVGDLRALVRELDRLHVPDETVMKRVVSELFGFTTYTGLQLIVPLASAPEPEQRVPEQPSMRDHLGLSHGEELHANLTAHDLEIYHRHLHYLIDRPASTLCDHNHPVGVTVAHEHQ